MERLEVLLVVAIATIFIFTELWVWIVRRLRAIDYAKQKKLDRESAKFNAPVMGTAAFESARHWVRPLHEQSIAKQGKYFDCLTRSVSALALALLALILSVTFFAGQYWFSTLSATIEVLVFLYVLVQFSMGRRANAVWLEVRAQAEIMRQAALVMATGAVASGANTIAEEDKHKWESVEHTPRQVRQSKEELFERIHEEWIQNHETLAGYVSSLNEPAFEIYLEQRGRRQLRWFRTSISRLQMNHKRRERLLRALFTACALLAIAKLVFSLPQFHIPQEVKLSIVVALFTCAAWSSAYTAFYLGSNQRSLTHRYKAQVRQIEEWLRQSDELKAQLPFDPVAAQRQIMLFEGMMESELVDWICITQHDSLEISP